MGMNEWNGNTTSRPIYVYGGAKRLPRFASAALDSVFFDALRLLLRSRAAATSANVATAPIPTLSAVKAPNLLPFRNDAVPVTPPPNPGL